MEKDQGKEGKIMSRLRLTGTLVIFLAAVLLTLPVGAQERVDVQGVVRGRDGSPQMRAAVQLSGPQRYVGVTNPQGEFSLRNVEVGDYVVTVIQGDKMHRSAMKVTGGTLDIRVPW